ncbi:hypothetical protein [Desulfovibrio ferrophilus]|uniref:Uncharacterized protein n=1 Tax=Desulfovibrio ferrophilus TaxID=241368 RepID=A0A2Z6AUE4_9BACT|nr:hypothetical protein [Desulfovibrio ferrophilus]BBD06848.1 uncharacterized protein DFE_0122 [Desulfovibrio ferrophilus]
MNEIKVKTCLDGIFGCGDEIKYEDEAKGYSVLFLNEHDKFVVRLERRTSETVPVEKCTDHECKDYGEVVAKLTDIVSIYHDESDAPRVIETILSGALPK